MLSLPAGVILSHAGGSDHHCCCFLILTFLILASILQNECFTFKFLEVLLVLSMF